MKVVVFDLDETLGYFVQLSFLWEAIHLPLLENFPVSPQYLFNLLLDMYPEYIRPGILPILQYVKEKKESKACYKVFLYSNNTQKGWSQMILQYFEHKLGGPLFDRIIPRKCRTSDNKTHRDLIRCTKLPIHTQICFVDDCYFPEMVSDNIYYIHLKPYFCDLDYSLLLERFTQLPMLTPQIPIQDLLQSIHRAMNQHKSLYTLVNKGPEEYEIDRILSKQILQHLHTFFQLPDTIAPKTSHKTMTRKLQDTTHRGTRRLLKKRRK